MASTSISGWSGAGSRTFTLDVSTGHASDTQETVYMKVSISGESSWMTSHLKVWAKDLDNGNVWNYYDQTASWDSGTWFTKSGQSNTFTDSWGRYKTTRNVRVYITGYAVQYSDKESYVNITIPAKTSYTITYNANGGSGAPASATKWYGENLTLSSTVPTRTNHQFLGWSTSSTATTATYSAGGTYTANEGATLYAVWKDITPATITAQSVTIASATKLNFSLTANVTCNQWQYSLDSGTWTTYSSTSGTSASGSVTVTSGTHTLQLRCRRSSNSVYTTGTKFTRDTVPPTVSFTVSDITTESFKIDATSSVASDRWWYSIDGGSTWIVWSTSSTTTTSTHTVSNLAINTTYQVRVRARKASNQMTGDSAVKSVSTQGGIVHVKVNGAWKEAIAYVKIGSAWKQAICYTKVGSSWRINT